MTTSATLRLILQPSDDGFIHVRCEGEMCLPNCGADIDPLVECLGDAAFSKMVLLDLDGTTFLDTSGLSWLLQCHERCAAAGGMLVLHSIPRRVEQLIRLLHMEQVFHTAVDLAAAQALAASVTQ